MHSRHSNIWITPFLTLEVHNGNSVGFLILLLLYVFNHQFKVSLKCQTRLLWKYLPFTFHIASHKIKFLSLLYSCDHVRLLCSDRTGVSSQVLILLEFSCFFWPLSSMTGYQMFIYVNVRDNSALQILWKLLSWCVIEVELVKLDVLADHLGFLVIEMLLIKEWHSE